MRQFQSTGVGGVKYMSAFTSSNVSIAVEHRNALQVSLQSRLPACLPVS